MKLLVCLAVLCAIASADPGRHGPSGHSVGKPRPPLFTHRFRRSPQGSLVIHGQKPLSGPDRRPSLDLNYQHQIIDDGRTKLNAFGGANLHGSHVSPQAGFGVEHRFKNDMFISGQGQVQRGPGGRLSPSFGAGLGWRFRREAMPYEEEEAVEEVY